MRQGMVHFQMCGIMIKIYIISGDEARRKRHQTDSLYWSIAQ